MRLSIGLATEFEKFWAKEYILAYHYLHKWPHPKSRPLTYIVRHDEMNPVGIVVVTLPHATRCTGWWGYEGLPTQWQVVDLARILFTPSVQTNGRDCNPETVPGFYDRRGIWRPAVATWAIEQVLARVQLDIAQNWPPVFPNRPYHILLAISYHDPKFHKGTIYRQSGALPVYTDKNGNPTAGPSGKFCWAWRLEQPQWEWQDIDILNPRQMRLELV